MTPQSLHLAIKSGDYRASISQPVLDVLHLHAAPAIATPAPAPPKGGKAAATPAIPPTSTAPVAEPPPQDTAAQEPAQPEPIGELQLSDGSRFPILRDLLSVLQKQAEEQAAKDWAEKNPPAAALAAPTPPPATPSPEPAPAKGGAKGAKAVAAAPPPPPAPEPVAAAPEPPKPPPSAPVPLTLAGRPHCATMSLPEKSFQSVLEQMQVCNTL